VTMVNHLLETSHPLSSVLRLRASARQPIFHPPYTLPSSVSRNPFVCRSYENTGGVGVFFPNWNRSHGPKPARLSVLSSILLPALHPRKRAGNDRAHP